MRGKVLYRNNKEVIFDKITEVEVRSGLVIIFGFTYNDNGVLEDTQVIEQLAKISLIKTWEEK